MRIDEALSQEYLGLNRTINGVKFTKRELELISHLLGGKRVKSIASFLGISTKTAENHIYRIMSKIDTNSRDGIIDFVEKSGKLLDLRRYGLYQMHKDTSFEDSYFQNDSDDFNPKGVNTEESVSNFKASRTVLINGKIILISNREFQCLKLLAHGRRTKDIAKYLEISSRTVECHLTMLKEKTLCHSHEQLVDFYWTYLEPKIIEL